MGYLSTDQPPRGEICVNTSSLMEGYFKNPEKTKEAIPDGIWLHSGDVGIIHPDGVIQIIDRAKNIFKLSQGEYISPEKIENVVIQSPWIAQAWIYGNSFQDFCVLVAVVEPNTVATKFGKCDESVLRDPTLLTLIHKDIKALADSKNLSSLERPKHFHLTLDPFSVENELLTPTQKLKRNIAKLTFKAEVDALYKEGPFKPLP